MSQRGVPEVLGVLFLVAFWFTEGTLQILLALVVVACAGVILAANHPRLVRDVFGLSLGLVPAGDVGGLPIVLAAMAGLLVLALRDNSRRVLGGIELWTLALLLSGLASVALVRVDLVGDVVEFAKWAIPTSLPLMLLTLPLPDLLRIGRLYAYGAAAGAVVGSLVLVAGDVLMQPFKLLGYNTTVVQFAYTSGAPVERLAATYLNPNAAGIFLMIGLVFSLAFLRGRERVVLSLVLTVGVGLTFSRSALGGLIIAALVMVAFHPLGFERRARAAGVLVLAGVAAVLIPPVNRRLFDSFGSSDAGTTDRADALRNLPGQLDGHWVFGLGWARPEFLDEALSAQVNFVANTPLLTVYRGGVITGFCLTGLLVFGCVLGWRAVRSTSWSAACLGAGFIGFSLVTLQLDYPVVTAYPLTTAFALFIVMLKRTGEIAQADADARAPADERVDTRQKRSLR